MKGPTHETTKLRIISAEDGYLAMVGAVIASGDLEWQTGPCGRYWMGVGGLDNSYIRQRTLEAKYGAGRVSQAWGTFEKMDWCECQEKALRVRGVRNAR